MSKAEERSKEIRLAALDYANNLDDIKPTDELRRNLCISLGQAFMKGAEWADEHQAEKDNELTWEDVKQICDIAFEEACRLQRNMKSSHIYKEQHYKEVLKRFKDFKERKEK